MNPSDIAFDISICICTYKRPRQLQILLEAIARQARPMLRVEIVVADNDPAASAQSVLKHMAATLPISIQSRHVTTPNISLARNTTVHAARGDWILFIDDDEEPDPNWIIALVETQRAFHADAVFGPVVPRFGPGTPAWMSAGGFFDRPRFPTGTRIGVGDARTGNVLVRRSALLKLSGPFDEAYGRTGGEDTILFSQLLARDALLIWCDEAVVHESVPPERATLHWLLRRSFRGGQSFMRAELQPLRGMSRMMWAGYLGSKALLQALVATLLTLCWLPFSRIRSVIWLRTTASQLGKLTSLTGHRYQEYRP